MKRLDQKLSNILNGSNSPKDFIIADAKDADMAFGITAPGPQTGSCRHGYNESEGCWKTLAQYREQIRAVIAQDIVDINPHFPASGPATGSFNGLHPKSEFLAIPIQTSPEDERHSVFEGVTRYHW